MTFADWLREIHYELGEYPPSNVVKHAAHTFYIGGLRRVQQVLDRGTSHWEKEWDVLVICDACRVDLLEEVCDSGQFEWLPNSDGVDSLLSVGSTSDEWMQGMFDEAHIDEMRRTAYVSGNLFAQNYPTEEFAAYTQTHPEQVGDIHTFDPKKLTERAVDIWRRRQELGVEKMIVHYFQPHTPFRSRPEWFDKDHENRTDWGEGFTRLRDGKIDRTEFRDAYLDNVVWAMEEVEMLKENCEADIGISADHGNGLGEWGVYGHPYGIPIDAVRRVPWIKVDGTDERTIDPDLSDDYLEQNTRDKEAVQEHLASLGYR